MQSPSDIIDLREDERKRLEKRLSESWENWSQILERCQQFGGFMDRHEIGQYLEVSEARVSVLINRGQFRHCLWGFSVADVESYRKNRRPGRPRKPRHSADQFELPGTETV